MREQSEPTRRDVLQGMGALAAVPACFPVGRMGESGEEPGDRPNVIVLISDQHRFSASGFASDGHAYTPALDRLAERGAVLEQVYCQAPLCLPARQSLVTGRYPHEHSSFANVGRYPDGQRTLAEAFRRAGYETALIGKSHCNVAGFDTALTLPELFKAFREENALGTKPGAYYIDDPEVRFTPKVAVSNPLALPARTEGAAEVHQVDGDIARHGREWLAGRDPERPFFLWASFLSPHPPLFPPEEWMDQFRDVDLPLLGPASEAVVAALSQRDLNRRRFNGAAKLKREQLLGITRSYYAAVAWMDRCVGEVLDQADKLAPGRETIILYTSDHGEMLGEHGLINKNVFFEGAVRVPAILCAPGRVRARTRIARVVQHIDLSATLLDMAGIAEPTSGRSLRGLLEESDGEWEDLAYAELFDGKRTSKPVPSREIGQMLRIGRHKCFRYSSGREVLFDLQADPGELVDRAEDPELREVLIACRARMNGRLPDRVRVIS